MEVNARKRTLPLGNTSRRVPLAETNSNVPVPLLKKARTGGAQGYDSAKISAKEIAENTPSHAENNASNVLTEKSTNVATATAKSARLVGDELKEWQASWRKIMRESVVYFDTQGSDSLSQHQNEQKRAQRALRLVGCEISPFYDHDVSIIVSRRPFVASGHYAANDIFNDAASLKIKVWDYDKVFRFLKNLGVTESTVTEANGNLSNLLREEKIFGSKDKDPNARRDDLHYLEKNYLYVYDLSQAVRPIAVREWLSDSYPLFHYTLDGKCPFIAEQSENSERKKQRRLQKFEATKEYRELLRKVSYDIIAAARGEQCSSGVSFTGPTVSSDNVEAEEGSTSTINGNETIDQELQNTSTDVQEPPVEDLQFRPPLGLTRNSSVIQPFNNPTSISHNVSTSKFYDVMASGYNGASNSVQFSMDSALNSAAVQQAQQGNGLGPEVSLVRSKNLNNLKRRIFVKRQLQQRDLQGKEAELKPGYCENCRVKYEHFDEHILSNRHRNFACSDSNFRDIDELIETLNECKSMGFVASNGDYSFS
ncbi:hypothetical protein PUMCH_000106 [Australozyma saopauloensis]|uniref:DBF4-type domain-containing protein n=1 Tax=Australozyma saopauloensis TaxID=291208 RepID=A0AAX4H2U1_9ASCO|nr:hypothetical protein PUMCH_000106 [[Candida] saopauloensis]